MNQPVSSPLAQAPRKRDALITITCVFVILAVMGNAFETVRQYVAAAAAHAASTPSGPRAGKLEQNAYTNGEAAHVTVTNLNAFDVESCFRAVVLRKTGGRVASVPVCTGVLKPRTTTVLVAPYHVGAVQALCEGEADRFGMRHIDWSACDFTTEEVK